MRVGVLKGINFNSG